MGTADFEPQIRDLLRQTEWAVALKERRLIHEKLGIGPSDISVLKNLDTHGPLPVSAVGRKVLLTSGSVTPAIDRMEKKGFVRRKSDPSDRRVALVELTQAGREAIVAIEDSYAGMLENVFSTLTQAEKSQLTNILRKLVAGG